MKNDIFSPSSKSIKSLFTDSDAFFKVPDYQRPYSWDDERVEQLWDDLKESFEEWTKDQTTSEAYFLGSVILIKNDEHFDIVDGQQRLTTLTILFTVLRDCCPNLSAKSQRILNDCIRYHADQTPRLRFNTLIDKQNEFEQTIINKVDFNSYSKTTKKKQPYLNTATIFKEKLKEIKDEDVVEKFLTYILENVQIITITCYKQSFAIKLFQVLNARGLDLSASDLIKTFLMNSLPPKEQSKFITDWRSLETLAKETDENLDNLFSLYLYFVKGNNPKQGLYEDLTKELKNRNSNEVVFEMKNFFQAYKDATAIQHKSVYCLQYLNHSLYWKTILTTAKFLKRDDINDLATHLRNFYFGFWIAGYNSTKIKQTSFRVIQLLKEKASLAAIKTELESVTSTNNVIPRVKQNLRENVYGEAWLKPLLLALEYGQVDITLANLGISRDLHIEHVLPQQYSRYPEWTSLYSDKEATLYLNLLPNLTLLSGKKNIEASNSPFDEKIEIYQGKGKDGLVAYRTTQWISDRVSKGSLLWDKEALKDRLEWFKAEILKEFGWDVSSLQLDQIDDVDDTIENISDDTIKRTKSNFHQPCVDRYSKLMRRKFEKVIRSTFRDTEDGSILICKVSKTHDKYSEPSYWYGLEPTELEVLQESVTKNFLLMGCGSQDLIIKLPASFITENLARLGRTPERHWHIDIRQLGPRLNLILQNGESVELNNFILSDEETSAT